MAEKEPARMVATVGIFTCELDPVRHTWQCTDELGDQHPAMSYLLNEEFNSWKVQAGPADGEPIDFAFTETVRIFKGKVTIHTPDPELVDDQLQGTRIY